MNPGELLERSLAYALGSVAEVPREGLGWPTPCAEWDLGELLRHLDDSVDALYEGVADGRVGLCPGPPAADPVCAFRERARALLGAWAAVSAAAQPSSAVGDRSMDAGLLAAVGALEIAVHGWDVARACGRARPIPSGLAVELLPVARTVVVDADRGVRFADPVGVPVPARPGDVLLAFLGRRPGRDSFSARARSVFRE
ncbi:MULTISPECIES: TIGR03086 family metal-binding protein [unclassified Streptomyces]|uniref:TIGR03086 family metal-binding protein n=1 Tax=unclassified Streptomyces TaxID=2593676 RepID=UPI00225BF950|nr:MULTISPECIES: TIGR03086 family metal-binding protein [unclassified Streptomyces]MCX4991930.1 TIGR03086 family metal-binding protein [Streptomyces sp. NBC_00568]MCX5002834.1 TIGR03086 family metal-binding protein [Streptomyces sp. NBC_00638]